MAGILCSGDVYFDRQDDTGNSTGLVQIGNTTQFQITEASTIKERTSKMNADYGQVKDSVAIKSPAKVALTLDEMVRTNLALVCLGSDAAASQAAAPTATKTFDKDEVEVGVAYELGATDVTVSSVKNASNAAFTGYSADLVGGLFTFTEAPTEDITVTYAVPAKSGYRIAGGASPTIKGRLLLVGKNLADQSRVKVDVYEAVLTPKSGLDFLASDFASAQFEGTLNTPAGKTSPYIVEVLADAA